jgi:two-component system response regulator YesN
MYDVMIIDDDTNIRERIKKMVRWDEMGLNLVCEAEDSDKSMELFRIYSPNIIIIDINIPIVSGIIVAKEMIQLNPDVKIIMITGYNDIKYVRDSIKVGAIDLILKPIDPEELKQTLMKTIELFKKQKVQVQGIWLMLLKHQTKN